jgi:hypothetical protein
VLDIVSAEGAEKKEFSLAVPEIAAGVVRGPPPGER